MVCVGLEAQTPTMSIRIRTAPIALIVPVAINFIKAVREVKLTLQKLIKFQA